MTRNMLNAIKNSAKTCMIALAGACFAFTGCDSVIYDKGDCVASYNLVSFVYDYNMSYADAFGSKVSRVSLLAFDRKSGRLVKRIDADRSQLDGNNRLALEVEPGSYTLLVWGGDHAESFDIAAGKPGESRIEDFHAYLHREDHNGVSRSTHDLAPLFHGMVDVDLPYASPSVPHYVTVPLKKDTNVVRVVLQQLSGNPLDIDDFNFVITDSNGWLNHDNSLRDDEVIHYDPWRLYSGSVDINSDPTDLPGTATPAAMPVMPDSRAVLGATLAEFTTSRLTTVTDPMLHITRKSDGRTVLKINVRDYALLVMGAHNKDMTPQEYLDRQDEYNMTFFLDKDYEWVSSIIIINDWRIIRNVTPIG